MASSGRTQRGSHAQLDVSEASLLELASSVPTDRVSFLDKEEQILELYDRLHEQQLEKALLTQDPVEIAQVDDVNAQLETAERELLEARATCSLRRKAAEAVLMTDPTIKSIHSTGKTVTERTLLPLVNQRDLLSLIYENLARAHSACLDSLSDAEVANMQLSEENKGLVRSLFELTKPQEKTGKDLITDPELKEQVEQLEAEHKQKKAEWTTIKRIVGASIAASGVDWASDEKLRELVMDKPDDDT